MSIEVKKNLPATISEEKNFIPIESRLDGVIDGTIKTVEAEPIVIKGGIVSVGGVEVETVIDTEYGLLTREEMRRADKVIKKNYIQLLKEGLVRDYIKRGKHLIDHAIEMAYEDNNVLIALMRKVVPDKTGLEVNFNLTREEREELVNRMKEMVKDKGEAKDVK